MVVREVTDADRDIGRRIKEARVARQVSIKTLGAAVNVTFQQMQKYEIGVNRISASRLATVAAHLDVPVTDLLGLSEPPSRPASYSPRAHALAAAFDRLPETAVKTRLHAFVLGLAEDARAS